MSNARQTGRRRGYRQVSVNTTGGSDIVLGNNSKRCGLLLQAGSNGGTAMYSLDGTAANAASGIRCSANAPPVYLGEDIIADVITGPVLVNSAVGNAVTVGEYFYLD